MLLCIWGTMDADAPPNLAVTGLMGSSIRPGIWPGPELLRALKLDGGLSESMIDGIPGCGITIADMFS